MKVSGVFISVYDLKNIIYLFRIIFGGQKVIIFSLTYCSYFWSVFFYYSDFSHCFSEKKICSAIINILCIDLHFNKHSSYTVIYFQEIFSCLTCIGIYQINEIESYRSQSYWALVTFFHLQLKLTAKITIYLCFELSWNFNLCLKVRIMVLLYQMQCACLLLQCLTI